MNSGQPEAPVPPGITPGRTVRPGRCPATGKARHASREAAERYVRRFPEEAMHAYADCPQCPGWWHVGHRPGQVCTLPPPVFGSESAARAAQIVASAGLRVAACGKHWHLLRVLRLHATA